MRSIVLLVSLVLAGSGVQAVEPTASTPAAAYQRVLDDFVAAKRASNAQFAAATTDEERQAIRARFPGPEDYYGRLLGLAEATPTDPAAVDALVWIVATSTNGYDAFKERGPRIERAMDLLATRYRADPRVGQVCLKLDAGAAPLRDAFLHTVQAQATERGIKGRATLALGVFLLGKAATVAALQEPGSVALERTRAQFRHRLPYYETLLGLKPAALIHEGEALLDQVRAEYADLPFDPTFAPKVDQTLGAVALAALERQHNLAVGQEAPAIDGLEVDGHRFQLREYRGKVVVLTFAGNWCGPCRAQYPAERDLVARFRGRPFVLLSVNTDDDPATLRASIAQGEITWRCWWEPGTAGPICTRWRINGFPQVFVLDGKGIIRARDLPTDAALADLVAAEEVEPRPARGEK